MDTHQLRLQELSQLAMNLSPKLDYHNAEHMEDVARTAALLAQREKVPEHERYILVSAAKVHDLYYVVGEKENEKKTVQLITPYLHRLGYSADEVSAIGQLTLATKFPTRPQNLLEEILCDADLAHFGRDDFFERTHALQKEFGIRDTLSWYAGTIKLLESQRYYTAAARQMYRRKKQENLAQLRRMYAALKEESTYAGGTG